MSNDISQLSIRALLSESVDYSIPMYQRNYAWEEGEITQLIQDVIDYIPAEGSPEQDYYIGTLVVFEHRQGKRVVYETIDGQQRLTTLSLLASYLKNTAAGDVQWYDELKLHFESREHSRTTFEAIFKGGFKHDPAEHISAQEQNSAILNGYRLIKKILPLKLQEKDLTQQQFCAYLFNRVQIMRVKVPRDTDLNHYFEIMNCRGEQLEKHEVLKARMMEVLNGIGDPAEREASLLCLHTVWEACANMERYVQMGFPTEQRNAIFGEADWSSFTVTDFDALRAALTCAAKKTAGPGIEQTLDQIIGQTSGFDKEADGKENLPERFNSVINFPNFLLHVLRVVSRENLALDDKRLITTFEKHMLDAQPEHAISRIKKFAFALLKCKYLYDHYIIKREFVKGSDGWSLKRFKWTASHGSYVNTFGEDEVPGGDNRTILMLLSAFHVSAPTLVYKHWLGAALHYLWTTPTIRPQAYLSHMESVAKAFVFDRFLAKNGSDYYDIVYKHEGICQTLKADVDWIRLAPQLTFGALQNNLIFNFLDYLLWVEHQADDKICNYEFTFRSSVEHYYPQTPLPGQPDLDPVVLNSFGNLCLISHSKNSRLSNFMPKQKAEYYANNTIDSIKQYLMMKLPSWGVDEIATHYKVMTQVLESSLAD
jgi:hypothetical protein